MSDSQVLFLQGGISQKLYEQTDSLRKLIAHQGLCQRLLPFVIQNNGTLDCNETALNQAIEEVQDRLAIRQSQWMRTFEDNMAMRILTESFAALTLDTEKDQSMIGGF
jgi:dynactin complex subunit